MKLSFVSKTTLNQSIEANKLKYYFAFFVVGLLNKSGVAMVLTAAEGLADDFNMESEMALILFCITLVGVASRFLTGVICIKIKHTRRICICAALTIISFLTIFVACYYGDKTKNNHFFYLVVGAGTLTGIAESVGEITIVGFLHGFPSSLISEVSSGTGFGGVFATLTLLGASSMGISNTVFFLATSPLILLYAYSFYWIDRQKRTYKYKSELEEPMLPNNKSTDYNDEEYEAESLRDTSVDSIIDIDEQTQNNKKLSI